MSGVAGDEFVPRRRADVEASLRSPCWEEPAAFFHSLPGYWPPDVAGDLSSISTSSSPDAMRAHQLLERLRGPMVDPDFGDHVRLVLPVPHPLDADWRFSIETRESLLGLASALSPREETLLLGTPSVFAHMCAQLDLRAAVLVDANQAAVEAANSLAREHRMLTAVHADLIGNGDLGLPLIFDTVIADPPWYFAEHRSFLDAASTVMVTGGLLLMAAAPRGTRPAAEDDRRQLLDHAIDAGFDPIETMEGCLEYTSPPFERAALVQCGLPAVPTNWRRADLLVLRKTSRRGIAAPRLSHRPIGWVDGSAGRVRFRARRGGAGGTASAEHLSGGISTSVSRLAPERWTANLWTSGNGAYQVSGDTLDGLVLSDPGWRDTDAGQELHAKIEEELRDLRRWGWA